MAGVQREGSRGYICTCIRTWEDDHEHDYDHNKRRRRDDGSSATADDDERGVRERTDPLI